MPIRRKRARVVRPRMRRTKRTTGYRRRTKPVANRLTMTRSVGKPISDRFYTKLKYAETITFSLSLGALTNWQVRSGMQDPDVTATGHQPMGYDQLATMYQRYQVFGIKYHFRFLNDSNQNVAIWVSNSNNNTFASDYRLLMERPNVQHTVCAGPVGYPFALIKGYHNCAKMHGLNKKDFNDDDETKAVFGNDPVKQSFINIQMRTYDTTATATVRVEMTLLFYCVAYDPIELPLS